MKTQLNLQTKLRKATGIVLGLLVGGAGWTVCMKAALAQSLDPLDNHNERTSDPFSGQNGGSYEPFFDMMHRVQLGNIRSVSEYSKDQQENVGSEAANFRARQMQLINQQNGQPVPGVTEPTAEPTQQVTPETAPAQ